MPKLLSRQTDCHSKNIVMPKILSRQQYWFLNPIFWQPQDLVYGVAPQYWHKMNHQLQQAIKANWETENEVRALPGCPHANV
jgi:hypothetical protein